MYSLQALPIYTHPEHFDEIEKFIIVDNNNDNDDMLYIWIRNILVSLYHYNMLKNLMIKIGSLKSLNDIYKFIFKNKLNWNSIFEIPNENMFESKLSSLYLFEINECYTHYPKSIEGGLSPEIIKCSRIFNLNHTTNIENLKSILKSEKLTIGDRKDQFPGVYFTLNMIYSQPFNIDDDIVMFSFSPALLKSPAWHCNINSFYGRVSDTSYDSTTFNKFIISEEGDIGEVIIHHECPLDYLDYIVVNESILEDIRRIVNDKYSVISITEYFKTYYIKEDFKKYDQNKKLISPLTFKCPPLSLNYYAYSDDRKIPSITTIKYALLNFGVSYKETMKYIKKYPLEYLVDVLIELNKTRIKDFPVLYHPPFSN